MNWSHFLGAFVVALLAIWVSNNIPAVKAIVG